MAGPAQQALELLMSLGFSREEVGAMSVQDVFNLLELEASLR